MHGMSEKCEVRSWVLHALAMENFVPQLRIPKPYLTRVAYVVTQSKSYLARLLGSFWKLEVRAM